MTQTRVQIWSTFLLVMADFHHAKLVLASLKLGPSLNELASARANSILLRWRAQNRISDVRRCASCGSSIVVWRITNVWSSAYQAWKRRPFQTWWESQARSNVSMRYGAWSSIARGFGILAAHLGTFQQRWVLNFAVRVAYPQYYIVHPIWTD